MKSKIIFLACTMLLAAACEKEQNAWKESRVSVTVYDENGNTLSGIPVKMYDEKEYESFEKDNLTPPVATVETDAQGVALFILPGEVWFSREQQRLLTFVVQEGGGKSNFRIWSAGRTINAGKSAKAEIRLTPGPGSPAEETPEEQPEEQPEKAQEEQPEETHPEEEEVQQPETEASLEKLSVTRLPHKTLYTLGEEPALDGLQLTGLYSDGSERPIAVTPEHVSGFSSEAPAERLELTISVEGRQASFAVRIAPVYVHKGILTGVYNGCSEITLPPHVTAIAPNAFLGNKQIARVVMNEGLTSIGERAFFNSGIQEIVFPSTLRELGQETFYYCSRLKRADLSHTQITRLPDGGLAYTGIEEITLPATLERIEAQALMRTSRLKTVTAPPHLKYIGQEAFRESGITSIQLPNSLSTLANRAFYYCPDLVEVSAYGPLSDSDPNASVQAYCFVGCPNLSHLEIPGSIRILGQNLITGNRKVSKLTIPARVTRINSLAFDNTGIREVCVEAVVPPATSEGEWYGFPATISDISVPAQSVQAYKTAKGWSKFAHKITAARP